MYHIFAGSGGFCRFLADISYEERENVNRCYRFAVRAAAEGGPARPHKTAPAELCRLHEIRRVIHSVQKFFRNFVTHGGAANKNLTSQRGLLRTGGTAPRSRICAPRTKILPKFRYAGRRGAAGFAFVLLYLPEKPLCGIVPYSACFAIFPACIHPFRSDLCHQKKVLALVLAFACAFTMFAGAAFTDSADISQTEAVDMLTALGVIDGYEDGSFRPDATITRAEAAKMIYTIRNGGNTNADAFAGGVTSFTDVYAGYWAEGYIKYCQAMGIISGKSTTSFDPEGTVTGTELAKMLLVTLGYDAEVAGLEGAGWDQKTIGLASENGLLDDVTASLSGACPRQYAAQIMYNAIGADIVVLKDGKYQKVETTKDVWEKNPHKDDDWQVVTVTANKTLGNEYLSLETSEMLLTNVSYDEAKGTYSLGGIYTKVEQDYSDLMGQKVNVLHKKDKNDEVYGVYAHEDSSVITTAVAGDVDGDFDTDGKLKIDGTEYKTAKTMALYAFNEGTAKKDAAGEDDIAGLNDEYMVKFIDNNDDNKIDTVVYTPFTVQEVTYAGKTSVTFKTDGNKDLDEIIVYDGIAKDDYAVIYAADNTVKEKLTAVKAEVVTGEVTGVKNGNKDGLVDGTWYSVGTGVTDKFEAGKTVTMQVVNGYVFNIEATGTATSSDIVFIDEVEVKTAGIGSGLKAVVYGMDGTSKEVQISRINGDKVIVTGSAGENEVLVNDTAAANTTYAAKMYTYTLDGEKYEIKSLDTDTNNCGYKGLGTATGYDDKELTTSGTNAKIADDGVFFVKGQDSTKVLSGSAVKAWGDVTNAFAGDFLYSESNGFKYAEIGVLYNGDKDVPGNSGDTAYGYITAEVYTGTESNTNYTYFTLWTVDGSVDVKAKTTDVKTTGLEKGDFVSYTTADEGAIKDVTEITTTAAVVAYDGDKEIHLADQDGADIESKNELDDDVVVIYVDTKAKSGVEGGSISLADDGVAEGSKIANVVYVLSNATNAADKTVVALFVDTNNDLDFVENPTVTD